MKRTKIVCTLGPASAAPRILEKMIKAGMNVARLNFSHGTHADHKRLIATVRAAAKKTGQPITIMQDLQGPKVRVGELPASGVLLKTGQTVIFTTAKVTGKKIPVGYGNLHRDLARGDHLLLDDGLLEAVVQKISGHDIHAKVLVGGVLTSHKGLNAPTASLSLSSISKKDKDDLRFGVKMEVDAIALSFVRRAEDIRELRRLIVKAERVEKKTGRQPIMVIAKIEKHEALENLDEIIAESDGVMVARGDLAIETPAADVPLQQKRIVQKCLAAAKPVIVATQMLDSMIRNPRPTRAEISDIANAVIDHADAVMLSGESATGKYPVEAVTTLATVAMETEASTFDNLNLHLKDGRELATETAIGETAGVLARTLDARAIAGSSLTGETARQVSRFRPEIPIYMAAADERVLRQMNFSWGVAPFKVGRVASEAALKKNIYQNLRQAKAIARGDRVIYVSGIMGKSGETNRVAIETVG